MKGHKTAFLALARSLPEPLLCVSTSGEVLALNRPAEQALGRSERGLPLAELAREDQEKIEGHLRMCYRSRTFLPGTLRLRRDDQRDEEFRTWGVRLQFTKGDDPMVLLRLERKQEATAVFVALNNELRKLNAQRRKLNEQRRKLDEQRELIRQQKAELLEFSAPMIDIWEGVLLVPLFGVLDEAYFERVLTNLLDSVSRRSAQWVILDLTGTPSMSSLVSASMVRIDSAVRLLGARCVLAGLGPRLARLFAADAELPDELLVANNLHTALEMCLGAKRRPAKS